MGLDMYLFKKTYVKQWDHHPADSKHSVTVKIGGKVRKDIKSKRISDIVEEVMYWRKANAVHSWFVRNCQDGTDDCKEYYVDEEQLTELATLCEKVVETKDSSLLEPESGFFFGSTEADEYYFDELKRTAKEIRELLAEPAPEKGYSGSFYYSSSW